MSLNPVDSASLQIDADLSSSYAPLMDQSDAIRNHVGERIGAWKTATGAVLATAFPLASDEKILRDWHERLQTSPPAASDLGAVVDEYVAFCRKTGHPANQVFWKKQFEAKNRKTAIAQKLADDVSISARLLLAEWRKTMDQSRAEWALREIASRRAALMAQLEELLQLLKALQERLDALGLDTGILLDLSKGSLRPQDIEQFARWAKYLEEDEGIRALCDLLGKIRQIDLSERIERVRSVRPVKLTLPDINSREEIVGIRFGKDIEHVLPSELALLADPDTALLFDLKYVESSLMCFDMQGLQESYRHIETDEERSVSEADKPGPMIICIDTSGSMSGMPETIAKAVALFLAARARKQQRPCYLINFSTRIDTLDLSAGADMEAVLRFLRMSFHGGTDVAPALEHALDTMEQDTYRNADLLIVSDFIMAGLPGSSLERIERRRLDGNRFHSLVVGSCYMRERLKSLFDNEWIYDPANGRIHELLKFERKVHEPR
jgi:uncharacterized protein with von Willebrand factor type A (vWA) domain